MNKHIKLYEEFVNEAKAQNKGSIELDGIDWINHTRLVKWMHQNLSADAKDYDFVERGSDKDLTLKTDKLSDRDFSDLLNYLGHQRDYGHRIAEALNEGHDGYMGKAPGSTREEATKKLQCWIDDDDDGQFRLFRGVKWVGSTTEDRLDSLATKHEDEYIVLGEVGGELTYAYWRRS